MSEDLQRRARAFGSVAGAYDRGRPSYPDDAVAWLLHGTAEPSGEQLTVLELGAGTGQLTVRLADLGHDVLATDPDEAMLSLLRERLPDVPTAATPAEGIPLGDRTVDVVVAAGAYHWFDPEQALPEIARVLRPGGHLALVRHERDEQIPWVRKLGRLLASPDPVPEVEPGLTASELFGEPDTETFGHWQSLDRVSILDLARSRSHVALLEESARERLLDELLALYDDYGRGMDGMQLPYRTVCHRSVVLDRPEPEPAPDPEVDHADLDRDPLAAVDRLTDSASDLPRVATGELDDSAMLLIDFR